MQTKPNQHSKPGGQSSRPRQGAQPPARPAQSGKPDIHAWFVVLRRHTGLLAIGLALLVGAVVCAWILPPGKVYLANGTAGSSQRLLAGKFRDYFARHGVELVLVDPPAASQSPAQAEAKKAAVSARFITAGESDAADLPGKVSLGSVQYAPVWLFYRGDAFAGGDPLRALANRRVAVGLDGTGTRNVLGKLLSVTGVTFARKDNLFELTHQDAAARFIAGTIDAVFIIDGVDSPTIQKLIAAPRGQLYAFNLIDALNVRAVFPPEATPMLASSTTLVVDRDLHPAIQWLFIMAARDLGQERDQIVARPGRLPAYLDRSVPLSPVVHSFYESGRLPAAFDFLPYWLASTFGAVWLVAIALLAQLALFAGWTTWWACKLLRSARAPS